MINVTQPFLPPIEEYEAMVRSIWKRNWLTNNGPLVNEFELAIKDFLGVPHMLFLNNGTMALQLAIKALNKVGEIITTPFSYVATTTAIIWENCKPVFVDIKPDDLNIDCTKIEEAITDKTIAILATHVFGNPCDVLEIQKIADKYNLKVIYDGAHCFGTNVNGKSIFRYGDICTTSFHATKLFHTIEGGAVFSEDANFIKKMALLRNFGHTSSNSFDGFGINAKNSEFHAAMGLCNIKYINDIFKKRKQQWVLYMELLQSLNVQKIKASLGFNYAYFPIIFENENSLIRSMEALNNQYIFPRRYFYPSLNLLNYLDYYNCPISESIASRILCLPLYHNLTFEEQHMIARVLLRVQNN